MKNLFTIFLCLICMPAFATDGYVEYVDVDTNPIPENVALLEQLNAPGYIDDTGIAWREFSSGYFELDGTAQSHATGLNPGDWHAFNGETQVLGTATCNSYSKNTDTYFAAGETRGANCWCKIIATTNNVHKSSPSKWVYRGEYENPGQCANLCTYRCSYNFLDDPEFRGEILNK